jgi:hypothetical protein
MLKKRILKKILSSKVKINNYMNNEKVETFNDNAKQAVIAEDCMKKKDNP